SYVVRPPRSVASPYTTLFRSDAAHGVLQLRVGEDHLRRLAAELQRQALERVGRRLGDGAAGGLAAGEGDLVDAGIRGQRRARLRSEEHTSELQSRENLVCRLL